MMSADEDITTELDRVVCKLMKLALRSSRSRQNPPPTRWLQCKLLDLLTLTEKAIERRKRHFIETYPLKAIEYDADKPVEMLALDKIKEDHTGTIIVDKYRHLFRPSDKVLDGESTLDLPFMELDLEDDFVSTISNDSVKDLEYIDRRSPPPVMIQLKKDPIILAQEETKLERTQAWVDEDIEIVPYPSHEVNFDKIRSYDTDHSMHDGKHKQKKTNKKYKIPRNIDETDIKVCKRSHNKTAEKKRKIKQDKNKRKFSSTKISKNLSRKKSNSVVKNTGNKYVAIKYGSSVFKYKNKTKERQAFLETTPISILESITELCPPKLNVEQIEEIKAPVNGDTGLINETKILTQPIAATKESLLIDIITDDIEETISLRRTVGTDADTDPTEEKEIVIRSFSNELCTKHNVSTENVLSQTIFLNDINEPSTSKGIRHVSMDVQCGPDVTPCYSALSTSTSLVKVPDISAIGVKMNTLFADVNMKSTDFGTSTQNSGHYETITPRMRSVGIKIRDSDVNIGAKIESSTMTQMPAETQKTVTIADPQVTVIANNFVTITETKLIKPISSTLKIEDSGSDFYESFGSYARSPVHFGHSPKTISKVFIESSESKSTGVTKKFTKYIRPTLSRGGVHVHSYRDKQVSEDIVFQGEWQCCRPKALVRRKTYNPSASKKNIDSALKKKKANSKEKISPKNLDKKEIKLDPKKPVPTRASNANLNKNKSGQVSKNEVVTPVLTNATTKVLRLPRHVINNVKMGSKLTAGSMTLKNMKYSYTHKKPTPIPSIAIKKDNVKTKEDYMPLYLKKNKQKVIVTNKTSLNKSIDSINTIIKINKTKLEKPIPPLVRSKTQEIKKELLKFPDEPRGNISFVVFRNDKEDKKDANEESTHFTDTKKTGCIIRRIQSFQSPNSSTCSSPNSVATVKAATVKIKNASSRRYSTSSSYKTNLIHCESDSSSPNKTKKLVKKGKSSNRSDSKDITNKENIPEPSAKSNFNNENESFGKSPFLGRHRNIYIAQSITESSHLQFTPNTLSKHQTKAQIPNKSNIKIPTQVEDTTEKKRSVSPSVSRRRSSNLSSSSNEYKLASSSPNRSNRVLVLEPHQSRPVVVRSPNVSPVPPDNSDKLPNSNLLTQWIRSSSEGETARSNNFKAMRQVIEEVLDSIDSPFDEIDSETVILGRDDVNESDLSASPTSFRTVITYEGANNSLIESDIEHALNRTFESVLGNESIISLNDTRLTVTDLDFLSLKSATSAKYSEYFLADSELNNSKNISLAQTAPNTSSVRDIFERKDTNLMQNPAGALAVKVFSGFSIVGEPIVGAQPDPVSIIDSETGSVALEMNRQTTSEELFVSGRSSDSYESCVIDEDAVVPNWLFNIISQQQSVAVDGPEPQLPPIPLPDPMYDGNGNVVDQSIFGAGAGAGDGRGMHSDHSQDSSGRGTSLSSSEVSSDPQSEAVLIDPSAFTNQFELIREPLESETVPTTASDSTVDTFVTDGSEDTTTTTNALVRNLRTVRPPLIITSDVDADISSVDTDVLDSSDN